MEVAKMGRPSKYTKELADTICEQLASGDSMRTVCKSDDMPSMATIFSWLRTNNDFLEQYERAKAEAADAMIDEIIEIADDGTNDWMEKRDKEGKPTGYYIINGEHVQRSRLRVDVRKWYASKLKPKKYGDKLDVTSDGEKLVQAPLIVSDIKPRGKDAPTET